MKKSQQNQLRRGFALASFLIILATAVSAKGGELAESYHWKNVRVGAGGFAPNILFSPLEKDLAYLRTDMGGAYRWEKEQDRWLPLQDAMAESSYQGIKSVALDPQDANVVYVAAGMYRHYEQAAILRSQNRGDTWEVTPVSFRMGGNEDGRGMGERLAVDPNDTRTLFFGSRHDGLWRSDDRGANWAKANSFPHAGLGLPKPGKGTHTGISFVLFDPASGKDGKGSSGIWVGVADPAEKHLYHSGDGGNTWSPIPNQPHSTLLPAQAAIDTRGILYITYSNGPGPNGVTDGALYRLDTHTGEWTNISPEQQKNKPAGGYMGLSLDRQRPGTLAVATMNRWRPRDTLWYSTDDGKSWQDIGARSRRDVSSTPFLYWGQKEADFGWWIAGLAIDPFDSNRVAYTTGATVYETRQLTEKGNILWRPWDQNVEQTAIITLSSPPEGPPLLSGFGDISGFAHEDLEQSPATMFTDPVFANTNTIDYAGQNPAVVVRSGTPAHRSEGGAPTLAFSEDHGRNWRVLPPPSVSKSLSTADREHVLAGNIAVSTNADGKYIFLATAEPLFTADRGKRWQPIRGLPRDASPVPDRVDATKVYALDFEPTQPIIYLSKDGGKHFSAQPTRGLPTNLKQDRPHSREAAWPLVTVPDNAGHLWLVSRKGLFYSKDEGRHFNKVTTELQFQQISFGKAAPGSDYPTVFAIATHQGQRGIWRSTDAGTRWEQVNGARHQWGQRFRTISGDPRIFGRVYLGTDGRGILYGEPSVTKAPAD